MKVHIGRLQLFIILVFVNVILFAGLIFLKSLVDKNLTLTINSESSGVLPILSKVNLRINSKAYIVYDTASRVVVAGKNENLRFSPASTAKIMTATISLEKYPLDRVIVAGNITGVKGSKMDLEEGESITVLNLLYGLMLPSGNDAAYVLAENFPGGEKAFIKRMNEKAKELDMLNTKFYDPAGYADENYTTAFDLARLATYAIKNSNFSKIVSTKKIAVNDESGKIIHNLNNLNVLLGSNGVTGIKTGFTDEAGGVLVTSINQNNRLYIIVVLNSPDRFSDTKDVIEQAIRKIRLLFY